jgi:PAP2 superfamily C-terminal
MIRPEIVAELMVMQGSEIRSNPRPTRSKWWLRALLVAIGLGAWFWTQSLLGHRTLSATGVGDGLHRWTAPLHDYLFTHDKAANAVLIGSSAVIDAVGVFLILGAIFGRSIRPFLAVLMLFALRQICQSLCTLPPPEGMIWHKTGVPTLLVTYGTSSDLFFSGHTALAVLGAVELARVRRWLLPVGILIAVGEAAAVLVLRAHYTMDVFTGAVTALFVADLAARIAPMVDRRIR